VVFIIYKLVQFGKIENNLLVGRTDEQCGPYRFGLMLGLKKSDRGPPASNPGQGNPMRAMSPLDRRAVG
jgi:hypothetical protein